MKNRTLTTNSAATAAFALLVAGCASSPDRPIEQLARAEQGIEAAEQSGAREFGAAALDRAQTKLVRARLAADQGETEKAARLAAEAELDAELAAAQASRGKTEESLREVQASISTLREEIERSANQ